MSTKPIREALELINTELRRDQEAYAAALEAVRAIEEMARRFSESREMGTADYDVLDDIAKEAP